MGEDASEAEDALAEEMRDMIDQVTYLAGGQCGPLADEVAADPAGLQRVRDYARLLRVLAGQAGPSAQPRMQRLLEEMDEAFAALDATFARCGIRAS